MNRTLSRVIKQRGDVSQQPRDCATNLAISCITLSSPSAERCFDTRWVTCT
jgi:hypothetical protein